MGVNVIIIRCCVLLTIFNSKKRENQAEKHWLTIFHHETEILFRFNRRNLFILAWIHLVQQCEVGCSYVFSLFFFFSSPFSTTASSSSSFSLCSCECIRRILDELSIFIKAKGNRSFSSLVFFLNLFKSTFNCKCADEFDVQLVKTFLQPKTKQQSTHLLGCRRRHLFLVG